MLRGLNILQNSPLRRGVFCSPQRRLFSMNDMFKKHEKAQSLAVVSDTCEIHFNLAVEDYLMNVVKPQCPVFFWWRNASNVVIGRHQNPWKECRVDVMNKDNVDLARRFSGGGAVYQDLGNSCFTLLLPESMYDQNKNNNIILNVLKNRFCIEGEPSGRNDLVVGAKKFSGSAFKKLRTMDAPTLSLQHGTLLINTDLNAVQKYLTPNSKKLQSKGVSSVASRVINLKTLNSNISHEALEEPLMQEFCAQYSPSTLCETIRVNKKSSFTKDPRFASVYDLLRDWDWRFGKTPSFSHVIEDRLSTATVELHVNVEKGKINDVKLFTDSLYPEVVPLVEKILLGAAYTPHDIIRQFQVQTVDVEPPLKQELHDLQEMICAHMS